MSREELAWSAGFFDGEGSIGCYETSNKQKYRSPRLSVQIAQVQREVLDKFELSVGVGRVSGPFKTKNENAQEYYKYSVEGFERVQHIVCSLWPWLSNQKKNDAIRATRIYLEWVNSMICRRGHEMKRGKGNIRFCSTCRSDSAFKSWITKKEVGQFA